MQLKEQYRSRIEREKRKIQRQIEEPLAELAILDRMLETLGEPEKQRPAKKATRTRQPAFKKKIPLEMVQSTFDGKAIDIVKEVLKEHPDSTNGEILRYAGKTHSDSGTLSRILAAMCTAGFVTVNPEDTEKTHKIRYRLQSIDPSGSETRIRAGEGVIA